MTNRTEQFGKDEESGPRKCGIIMPMADIPGYPGGHWDDVLTILRAAISDAGLVGDVVSKTGESTVIHKTIVQNLGTVPIVVCDVSGKNPNVMFELGMRLTFDLPTVVVKDDSTDYSFDTSPIEHISYPSDLRHAKVEKFKRDLAEKISTTLEVAHRNPNYSTFLKHFEIQRRPSLEVKEVGSTEFIMSALNDLAKDVASISQRLVPQQNIESAKTLPPTSIYYEVDGWSQEAVSSLISEISQLPGVIYAGTNREGNRVIVSLSNIDPTAASTRIAAREYYLDMKRKAAPVV